MGYWVFLVAVPEAVGVSGRLGIPSTSVTFESRTHEVNLSHNFSLTAQRISQVWTGHTGYFSLFCLTGE